MYSVLSLYYDKDSAIRRLSGRIPVPAARAPSSHCLVMAHSRQEPHLNGGPDGELLEARLHTGNKRTSSEAFGEVDEPAESIATSKKLHEEDDTMKLREFAESVLQKVESCGVEYRGSEEVPRLPGFMPQTDNALNACQTIITTAVSLIKNAKYQDKDTYGLLDSVSKSQYTIDPSTQRIGFTGSAGVGGLRVKH